MYKENFNYNKSFLVYRIGDDLFASDSDQVRNILDTSYISKNSPQHSPVININGNEIPLLDIAQKMDISNPTQINPCLIIIDFNNNESEMIGIIVDEVKALIDIQNENFVEVPRIGSLYREEYINRIAKINEEIIRILDLKNIVNREFKILKNSHMYQKQIVL